MAAKVLGSSHFHHYQHHYQHEKVEGDRTLGGEHTMQYTDVMLCSCTPETYTMPLTSATPNKFKKNRKKDSTHEMLLITEQRVAHAAGRARGVC